MHVYKDKILETTTTTGTSTYLLNGPVAGYRGFDSVGNGSVTYYVAYEVNDSGNATSGWEVGLGTWSTGGNLARTRIISSSNNTSAAVDWAVGTKKIAGTYPSEKISLPNMQAFTSTGSNVWTKPLGCHVVNVYAVGGGGGGGSGRKDTSAAGGRLGGGGGGGGGYSYGIFSADYLPSTATVYVGKGGAGGDAVIANTTNGNAGTSGEPTFFGTFLRAHGGGGGGGGVTFGAAVTGGFGGSGTIIGGDGAISTTPATIGRTSPAGGGGGGAGGSGTMGSSANVLATSGGGWCYAYGGTSGGNVGTGIGSSGRAGGSVLANTPFGGAGGSGGNGNHNSTTGQGFGGPGGLYGGGGGGGGVGANSFNNSGTGGAGASGICVIVSW